MKINRTLCKLNKKRNGHIQATDSRLSTATCTLSLFLVLLCILLLPPPLSATENNAATAAPTSATTTTPPSPDMEIFASKGLLQWTEQNPYIKKLSETPFWKDLHMSGQLLDILSLSKKLETEVGVQWSQKLIRELITAPAEISMWDLFDKQKDTGFLITIHLQPHFQTLIKMAELYAQSTQKTTAVKKGKFNILKTKWLSKTLFHLVRDKQLILSNRLDLLALTLENYTGKKAVRLFRDSPFYQEFHKPYKSNFKCRVNLGALFKNLMDLLDKENINLALNLNLEKEVNFEPLFMTAQPGFEAEKPDSLTECAAFIPQTPFLAVSGVYPASYLLGILKRLPALKTFEQTEKADLEKDVISLFKENFFFYVNNLQTNDQHNILEGVMGFAMASFNNRERKKITHFLEMMINSGEKGMVDEKVNDKIRVFSQEDKGRPAFCLLENRLLVGTNRDVLIQCLEVYGKKKPSLSDGKTFGQLGADLAKGGYCQVLFNPAGFCRSVGEHLLYVAGSSRTFNAADIKHRIIPALDILGKIPTFALFLDLQKETLKGNIKFIEKTK